MILKYSKTKISFAFIGLVFGFVVAHPYVMFVYFITGSREFNSDISVNLFKLVKEAFTLKMFPMAFAFSFFCFVIGWLLGALYDKRLDMARLEIEAAKQKEELESLNRLLSILSHFILNSTLIIKSQLKLLKKELLDKDTFIDTFIILDKIEKQIRQNEEALNVIKDCDFLKRLQEQGPSLKKVLELTHLIEKKIKK